MTAQKVKEIDFGLETLETVKSYIDALAKSRLPAGERLRRYRLALRALKGENFEQF